MTCSRFGISLRRKILHRGPTPHLRDPNGRAIPPQGSVGVTYARETEEVSHKIVATGAASANILDGIEARRYLVISHSRRALSASLRSLQR